MDAASKQHYRQLLTDLSARIEPEVAVISDSVRSPVEPNGEESSSAPLHLGDHGTNEFLRNMAATLLENEVHIATETRNALQRLDKNCFGVCERCGGAISQDRLDAIPYTRFCISCAQQADGEPIVNFNHGRPTNAELLGEVGEMGERRRDRQRQDQSALDERSTPMPCDADRHASGTAGGGTSVGGLAGTTIGRGDPDVAVIEDATGSGQFDSTDTRDS